MRKNIVAGNWKMNKTLQEGIELAKELNEALANETPNCDVIICTPFIHLASVTPLVDAAKIGVGSLSGVALALYFGGVGSIFWMCIISLFLSKNSLPLISA